MSDMSVYLIYEQAKRRYSDAMKNYLSILDEKEELFNRTQPRSVQYDAERVEGGTPVNSFDEYLIKKEERQIDERLAEAERLLHQRDQLLQIAEVRLKASQSVEDKIYIQRIIEKKQIYKISSKVGYSQSQVFRILKRIKENIERCE